MAAAGTNWSAAMVDRLKVLWREGASAKAIGAEFGISRNAVIGKVHRLGLGEHSAVVVVARPRPRHRPPPRLVSPPPSPPPPPPPEGITLMELDDATCHWPIADGRYCGRAVDARPYCPEHNLAAFAPSRRRAG